MKQTTTKRIEWSYPTSPNADLFRFADGCYTVEIVNGIQPGIARAAFASIKDAVQFANELPYPWDKYTRNLETENEQRITGNEIVLTHSFHRNKDNREYVEIKPVLKTDCLASGELRFAVWYAWLDEPETHREIRARAIEGAKDSLRIIVAETISGHL